MFGNNLRAFDNFLVGGEGYGGQGPAEVDGAQGLGDAAPVGTDVIFVSSTLDGIDLQTVDQDSAYPCRTAFDPVAELGVVTVMTDGPRGQIQAVQAYIIKNPVFRIGRRLSEEASGLGPVGIGLFSSLADLQIAYPGLEVLVLGDGRTVALTPVESARERLLTTTTERQMVFLLDAAERVEEWRIGVPQYAGHLCG